MHAVLRGVIVYMSLLLIFRVAGKRTLSQTSPFEFVLLLIISETVQQAMVHNDQSATTGLLLVLTLVAMSVVMSILKQHVPAVDKWLDGQPLVILEHGRLNHKRMQEVRVDESEILEAARMAEGIERLDQLEYAIIERSGEISVITRKQHAEQNPQAGGSKKEG